MGGGGGGNVTNDGQGGKLRPICARVVPAKIVTEQEGRGRGRVTWDGLQREHDPFDLRSKALRVAQFLPKLLLINVSI